ncbi:MAG TPA: hypothetical protein VNA89_16005 [Gemmatimonadaceae bacterium]|nr:hypothetical protein [Gemmatimonadaceae bacterium]
MFDETREDQARGEFGGGARAAGERGQSDHSERGESQDAGRRRPNSDSTAAFGSAEELDETLRARRDEEPGEVY